ncbi:MtrAB system accessory lipoprotein LpqB [Flindersiella endophytica]
MSTPLPLLLLALVAAVSVAAGCAAVPTSGPIVQETLAPAQRDGRTDISITDVAPKAGDTPLQTVSGFIEAMASYQPGYKMARQFLTPQAAARWKPDRRILVYEGSLEPSEQANVIALTGTQNGEVGDDGAWRAAPSGKRLDQKLTLKKVKGEWRIDQLPNLVMMSRSSFEDEFDSFNLYFFDPSFEILVPDPVFLPLRSDRGTALANALVRGPTHWLASVVRSAVPPGSRLGVRSVQIDDKVAVVDLAEPSRRLTSDQHQRLAAQLAWTLRQAGVDRVRLSVDKVPLDQVTDEDDHNRFARYDPAVAGAQQTAYAISDGSIVMVGSTQLQLRAADVLDYVPQAFAVALRSNSPAEPGQEKTENTFDPLTLVGKDKRSLTVYTGRRTSYRLLPKYPFHNILSLSNDRTARLWVVDNDHGKARIVVIDEQQRPSVVAVQDQKESNIVDLKVSRDGTRVAMLVEKKVGKETRSSLLVGLIERGEQLRIRGLREVETGYAQLSDLSWSGTSELVMLVRNTTDEVNDVLRVSVDGWQTSLVNDAPAAPMTLEAAPGRPLIVVDESKVLFVQDDRPPWNNLGQALRPAYAG